MKVLSLLLFLFPISATDSQADTIIKTCHLVTDTVYSDKDVDKKPEPVKGMNDVYRQVAKTFRYPAEALKYGVQGKVLIYMTISSEGKLADVSIKQGLNPAIDEEVIRTLKVIKVDWLPGMKNNQKVNTKITFPISLNLDHE